MEASVLSALEASDSMETSMDTFTEGSTLKASTTSMEASTKVMEASTTSMEASITFVFHYFRGSFHHFRGSFHHSHGSFHGSFHELPPENKTIYKSPTGHSCVFILTHGWVVSRPWVLSAGLWVDHGVAVRRMDRPWVAHGPFMGFRWIWNVGPGIAHGFSEWPVGR